MLNSSKSSEEYSTSAVSNHDTLGGAVSDNTQKILFTVYYMFVSLVGVIGNITVVLFFLFKSRLKQYLRLLFANLSALNVFVLLICLPNTMQDIYMPNKWIYGEFTCNFNYFGQRLDLGKI
jgi:hypothetical protein